jgi:two-component system phosphate regulon sensor histidine kinase PhoR
VTSEPWSRGSRDGVPARLWRLVSSVLILLILVGIAGVAAVQYTTTVTGKLSRGYGPANDAHNRALTLMLDSETSIRGYLITANRTFLAPYMQSHADVVPSLAATRAALNRIGNHGLDTALSAETAAAQAWLTDYAEPMAAGPGGPASVSLDEQQHGKDLFDAYRVTDAVVSTSITQSRDDLRARAARIRAWAIPSLSAVAVLAVLLALLLAVRTANGISRPLTRLWEITRRLDRGDLTARADPVDGPTEVRALATAVNALGERASAEIVAERDAEHFRQRTRLISAALRRTASPTRMASQLVRGVGDAYEADRVWLHTFADERVPSITAQWHRDELTPFPDPLEQHTAAAHELADRLWDSASLVVINDHRSYEATPAGEITAALASSAGISASVVVPVGDSTSAFGLLWIAMTKHPRIWQPTETGVAQHLAADLAHSLAQAHIIEQQLQAVELLRELDQAKSDFISTVSHELRTPLTSINGYLEMLHDGDGGTLPPRASEMLSIIDRNATRLRNLIEDLLTQSRIDAGRLRLNTTKLDVVEVVDSCINALAPIAASGDVSIDLASTPTVPLIIAGDIQQLEQVVTNVLSNAIKFTRPGGIVTVKVEQDDGWAIVECSDNGIGIPAADMDRLFTRFFRAANASAAALPGTGLGLAIVHEIVQRHGGSIDLQSTEGVGTVVTVRLPEREDAMLQPESP